MSVRKRGLIITLAALIAIYAAQAGAAYALSPVPTSTPLASGSRYISIETFEASFDAEVFSDGEWLALDKNMRYAQINGGYFDGAAMFTDLVSFAADAEIIVPSRDFAYRVTFDEQFDKQSSSATLYELLNDESLRVVSGEDGSFTLSDLPDGKYLLVIDYSLSSGNSSYSGFSLVWLVPGGSAAL